MELLRFGEIPCDPSSEVFRPSRLVPATAAIGCLALAALPIFFLEGFPLPFVLWAASGVMAAASLFYGLDFLRASGRDAWVLRAGPEGLLVKFRSWRNSHLPDDGPGAVRLDREEIEGIGKRIEAETRGSASASRAAVHLDIVLREGDHGELARRLEEERRREDPIDAAIRSRSLHRPVRLIDGRVLRIEWATRSTRIVPGIDEALAVLGKSFPIRGGEWDGPNVEARVELPVVPEDEGRLRVLALAGRTIEAVRLARRIHGVGLEEAKEIVDGIRRASGASEEDEVPPHG